MVAISKNVLFPGHNHLLTTDTDDPTLWLSCEHQQHDTKYPHWGQVLLNNTETQAHIHKKESFVLASQKPLYIKIQKEKF